VFKIFKRTRPAVTEARMVKVCQTCYVAASLADRMLMTMCADRECESCKGYL
jgi:hypothetical protein